MSSQENEAGEVAPSAQRAASRGHPGRTGGEPGVITESRSDQQEAEDDDLRDSLVALSRLSSHQLGLEDLLRRVAAFAVRAIPGAQGAGLTLLEQNRRDTLVTTAAFVAVVDNIQYSLGQGPCIDAADQGRTVMSGSLGGDQRWPQFGGRVARLGVHSVISLPLLTPDGVVGAMNVYARDKHVFDERAAELGELYAVPASIAAQNAQILADARRAATRLQAAFATQSVIDQAIGIMIARGGGSAGDARARLQTLSQHEHTKLAALAQQIVDEAARRAHARQVEERPPG